MGAVTLGYHSAAIGSLCRGWCFVKPSAVGLTAGHMIVLAIVDSYPTLLGVLLKGGCHGDQLNYGE